MVKIICFYLFFSYRNVNNTSTEVQQDYASPDCAPDRQSALDSFEELQLLNPARHWHLVLVRFITMLS